ncbi:PEP-CTERM sorting domain-containing protein [Azohydromonas aeria]|uniref:PEP-CTERM sorting domain-containing protein n=1 Tax=Azohydromonas aeria TaxID=2590212 RepID=UPI0012F9A819|nr:PEP-CTERM sorting domain-containing protein [Azohydromonas aeria]
MRAGPSIAPRCGARTVRAGAALFATLLIGAHAGAAPAAPPQYRVINLGLLEFHSRADALDINNRGEVVGRSIDGVPDGETLGFLWRRGMMQPLRAPGFGDSSAHSINELGQIGLQGFDRDNAVPPIPFLYDSRDASVRQIPTPSGAGTVTAINASGQATGIDDDGGPADAYFWDGTASRRLAPGASSSIGNDVNDAGVVVGYAPGVDGLQRAARWEDGTLTFVGEPFSEASAINEAGQIVGQLFTRDGDEMRLRGFIYDDTGGFRLLDSGRGFAGVQDINERGWIVGTVAFDGSNRHAALWHGETLYDLNTLLTPESDAVWTLTEARALNDRGWIVGTGDTPGTGGPAAFLAVPVPEPGAWALMLAGVTVAGAVARRRAVQHMLR